MVQIYNKNPRNKQINQKVLKTKIVSYRYLPILTSLPQNQYVISISDLRERVANIMQIRK